MKNSIGQCKVFLKNHQLVKNPGKDCDPNTIELKEDIENQVSKCLECEKKVRRVRWLWDQSEVTIATGLKRIKRARAACEKVLESQENRLVPKVSNEGES